MYYEAKQGDDELITNCLSQSDLADDDEDSESKSKPVRKRRRNEASMLQEELKNSQFDSELRPKRAAAIRFHETRNNQRKITDFLAAKRSPKKVSVKSFNVNATLSSIPVNDSDLCPICNRLIPIDILEIHTNACLIHHSDAAKELSEKGKQRAKIEAKVKETLFQRPTSNKAPIHLTRNDSETTTCPTCGMQMTISRLENQHKNECINRVT